MEANNTSVANQIKAIFNAHEYYVAIKKIETSGLKEQYIKMFGTLNCECLCEKFKTK